MRRKLASDPWICCEGQYIFFTRRLEGPIWQDWPSGVPPNYFTSKERSSPTLRIFVDADACPVQNEVIQIAGKYDVKVYFVKNYAHFSHEPLPPHVEVIYVDKGADVVDFEIVARIRAGDIVITQDYGLASICLAKKAHVLHHKGFAYTNENIDRLLDVRHTNAKLRRAGYKTKGPKPFTDEERDIFQQAFESFMIKINNNSK